MVTYNPSYICKHKQILTHRKRPSILHTATTSLSEYTYSPSHTNVVHSHIQARVSAYLRHLDPTMRTPKREAIHLPVISVHGNLLLVQWH